MALAAVRTRVTLAEYLAMPESILPTEFVGGEEIVLPTPGITHQRIVGRLFMVLQAHLVSTGWGEALLSPLDLLIREDPLTIRQPDLLVLSHGALHQQLSMGAERPLRVTPSLIVEISSPSNTPREIRTRLADYAEIDVSEVWLISAQDGSVEVLVRGGSGYQRKSLIRGGEVIRSTALTGLELRADQLFT